MKEFRHYFEGYVKGLRNFLKRVLKVQVFRNKIL